MFKTEPLDLDFFLPATDLYLGLRYGVLATTFGCPFRCEYCASPSSSRPAGEGIPLSCWQTRHGSSRAVEIRDLAFYATPS